MILKHFEAAQSHWSNNVREAADAAIRSLLRVDALFSADFKGKSRLYQQKTKLSAWATIARRAAKRDKSLNLATNLVN